jgi:hypothetical protein
MQSSRITSAFVLLRLSLFLTLLVSGCAFQKPWEAATSIPPASSGKTSWEPTDPEKFRAEGVARQFAHWHLSISGRLLVSMKTDFFCHFEAGKPIITVGFFDPRYFQPDSRGHFNHPLGGFPTYFSVDVDPIKWRVVSHYASPE